MADLLALLALARRRAGWMLLGAGFAVAATAAGIALLGLAGGMVAGGAVAGGAVAGAGWLRALALGRTGARYLERLTTHEATFRVLADLRLWFFARAIPLAPARLGGWRGGDLMARLVSDIDALDGLYLRLLTPSLVALLTAAGLAVVLGSLSWTIAVAALAPMALAGLGVPALAERAGRRIGAAQVAAGARLRVAVVDLVQGMADLTANQALGRQAEAIAAAEDAHEAALRRQAAIAAVAGACTQALAQLALVAVVLGLVAIGPAAAQGSAAAVAVLMTLAAFEAVAPLPLAWQLLGRTRAAARRVREVAEAAPAVLDPPAGRRRAVPTSTAVAFEGVRFGYPGAGRPALDGVDLAVPDGGRLGIAGPSGAGKSTLLALLLRFEDPAAGRVTLGGVDLRDVAVADLHARIGVLSQTTAILAGTLRENLAIAAPDAGDAALLDALGRAGLEAFAAALPDGLDTWLGEAGVAVSGGEARRVALARVLLKDAPLLLLDEPTEGLDADTERAVLAALEPAMAGRTVIAISHRPAPLAAMHRVVRLEEGRVVEG